MFNFGYNDNFNSKPKQLVRFLILLKIKKKTNNVDLFIGSTGSLLYMQKFHCGNKVRVWLDLIQIFVP